MAYWTVVDGHLADGLPVRAWLAEHAGQVWSAAISDAKHPRDEQEFLSWLDRNLKWQRLNKPSASDALGQAAQELAEYFASRRLTFTAPLYWQGTPFQLRVWQELTRIPFGTTSTYGSLAENIGQPAACRAVGAANGQNRLVVFIPCHRVIATGGKLCGFAGGIGLKKRLLAHEAAVLGLRLTGT
jgi:methylated-DNA-[protein]-cysteine S-methyltransferase